MGVREGQREGVVDHGRYDMLFGAGMDVMYDPDCNYHVYLSAK